MLGGFQRYRRNLGGFPVGGGIETTFTRHTDGKLEYIYTRLSDDSGNGGDLDRQRVQAAVGLRF